MPSLFEVLDELNEVALDRRADHLETMSRRLLEQIARRYDRNVLYYASAFLQKPQNPGLFTSISMEDINGVMAGIHKHDFSKGLLLILHTPGGMAEAAQSIIDCLRSKFSHIDVLVPTYAMSAGTMIALGCDKVVMGRQSQLGPTDPQIIVGSRAYSAHSIVEQSEEAKEEVANSPVLAHAWAPVLRSFAPALLQEARKSITYGQTLVQEWLTKHMFSEYSDAEGLASKVAAHFGGNQHGSHGRRIDRDEARRQGAAIEDLEEDQNLQEETLILYHISTIIFDSTPALKLFFSSNGRLWVRNM